MNAGTLVKRRYTPADLLSMPDGNLPQSAATNP